MQHLIGLKIGYRYRNVDIDGVLLNTLGGAVGYSIYKLVPKRLLAFFE